MFGISVWQSTLGGSIGAALGSDGPFIVFSGSLLVSEDTATTTHLGTFSTVGGSGSYTYAFASGGNPGSKFSISTDVLVLANALDYETTTSYALVIEATNGVDAVVTQHFTIHVVDVYDSAATLSSPTDISTGSSTATLTVATNDGSGTLYVVVTTSATPPSAAQVKLGRDHASAAAAYAGNQVVSSIGTKTFSATGLDDGVDYTTFFMQENVLTLQSTVAAADGFTTDDVTAPGLTNPTDIGTDTTTGTATVDTDKAEGTLYVVVTTSSTPPTAAQVKAGLDAASVAAAYASSQSISTTGTKTFSVTGLEINVAYTAFFMQEDASGNQSAVSAADGFMTDSDQSGQLVGLLIAFTDPGGAQPLYGATDASAGTTTATISATTSLESGTLYTVVTTSSTPPTAAQVKAGHDHSNVAAAYASSQAITAHGIKTFDATGLSPSTAYTSFFMQENDAAVQSAVVAADGFTTDSPDVTAPTLSNATDVSASTSTGTIGVDTNEGNGTLYTVVTTSSTPPTKAQVKLGQDNSSVAAAYASNQAITSTGTKSFDVTGLAAGTAYTSFFMHEDAATNQSTVAAANGFTTDASTSGQPTGFLLAITKVV